MMHSLGFTRSPVILIISWEIVKFGLLFKDKKVSYVINNFLLLLKIYIHKCNFFKTPPRLVVFKGVCHIFGDGKRDEKSQSKIFVYFIKGFWFHIMKISYSPTTSLSLFIYLFFSPNVLFYVILNLLYDVQNVN